MSELKRAPFKERYENYINGTFVPPTQGEYFDNISPIDGKPFTQVAHSTKEVIDKAVEAASNAFETWSKTSATERSNILFKIAERVEKHLEQGAVGETSDDGKAGRGTSDGGVTF